MYAHQAPTVRLGPPGRTLVRLGLTVEARHFPPRMRAPRARQEDSVTTSAFLRPPDCVTLGITAPTARTPARQASQGRLTSLMWCVPPPSGHVQSTCTLSRYMLSPFFCMLSTEDSVFEAVTCFVIVALPLVHSLFFDLPEYQFVWLWHCVFCIVAGAVRWRVPRGRLLPRWLIGTSAVPARNFPERNRTIHRRGLPQLYSWVSFASFV